MRLGLGVMRLTPEVFWNLEQAEWMATLDGYIMQDGKETERARTICHFISALGGKPIDKRKIFPVWYDNEGEPMSVGEFKQKQADLIAMAALMNATTPK
jgi:hypothetical protein